VRKRGAKAIPEAEFIVERIDKRWPVGGYAEKLRASGEMSGEAMPERVTSKEVAVHSASCHPPFLGVSNVLLRWLLSLSLVCVAHSVATLKPHLHQDP
jgi:hypothetical protein